MKNKPSIGDTFRWKGENVSTTEVAEVLSKVPGILEANVYGTAVPGADGRACMAACVCSKDLNLDTLLKHVKRELPAYAVPLFIRQLPQIEITGTFKHTKVQLRDEGIDLKKVKDPIIWLSPVSKQYETFDAKASALIVCFFFPGMNINLVFSPRPLVRPSFKKRQKKKKKKKSRVSFFLVSVRNILKKKYDASGAGPPLD